MRKNLAKVICLGAVLISSAAFAQSGETGNWTGTYTYSVPVSACSKTFTASGNAAITLLQTGTSVSGRIDLTNFLTFNGNCTPATTEVARVIVGTISGSSIFWNVPNDQNMPQFSGSIAGNSITAQWADASGGTGSLTVMRTAGDPPAVNLTGTWSGTYNFTDRCSNGATKTYSGPFTIGLAQTGADAGGVVTMQSVPLYDQNCTTITSLNMTMAVAGAVSGSTFTGGVFEPSGSFDFPISATISGASMSGTAAGASGTNTTGTFALTQSSTALPAADLSGSYEGSYNETDNETSTCLNIGTLSFSGTASLSIVQAGTAVSGWLIFHNAKDVSSDGFGNCIVVNIGDNVLPLYGTLSNNTVTLDLLFGGGVEDLFKVTFNGNDASGTLNDTLGDVGSFMATKSASAAPPVINSFSASSSAIVAGQPATLSWSVSNATAVSIDNGIGLQPVSGSVSVSPTQTTVYTLTATGPAGSISAQTTITVFAPGTKRRAVRL